MPPLRLTDAEDISKWVVEEGHTHRDVSALLCSRHPGERGYSERSVRRLCADHGIHYRCGLTEPKVDDLVSRAVWSVGNYYGRKTVHRLLRWKGVHVGQNGIGRLLARVAPAPMVSRHHLARLIPTLTMHGI